MALSFTVEGQGVYITSALATAVPLSAAFWVSVNAFGGYPNFWSISDSTGNRYFAGFPDPTGHADCGIGDGTNFLGATSTTTFSAATWVHFTVVFTTATSRSVYLNGGGVGNDTSNVTPTSLSATVWGSNWTGTPTSVAGGSLAWGGIWSVALSANDALSLSKGASPKMIRRASLLDYSRLNGLTASDFSVKGRAWTYAGTPAKVNSPRIYAP